MNLCFVPLRIDLLTLGSAYKGSMDTTFSPKYISVIW